MNVTKILIDEHENILKIAEALENEAERMEKSKEINKEFILNVVSFIRNYADKLHHAKEEDILFKEFNRKVEEGCVHCNPVEQMLFEHEEGRKFVKMIETGLKNDNKKEVIEGARGYASLIKEHIFKEDNILYPMTEDVFDSKKKEEITKKFEDTDSKKLSEIKKYLQFIRRLK